MGFKLIRHSTNIPQNKIKFFFGFFKIFSNKNMYTWAPHPRTKTSQCPHWEWNIDIKTKRKILKATICSKTRLKNKTTNHRKRKAANYRKGNWNKTKKEEKRGRRREMRRSF